MNPEPQLVFKTVYDAIQQFGGISKFGARITAGGKGRSHERSPLIVSTMNHFS